ncbi:MAG TPA: SGNH hydrolase domain-containing protein, partial [Solirubrobacteraceae bacterium]|nr:SGNH hydrolase domain-containing protein [Solirubrobacteraceae bacterium]
VFFVNSAGYDFVGEEGQDRHAAGIAGYRAALDALPPSVQRIVVIRDNPRVHHTTLPCVGRAIRRRQRPGRRCALARDAALIPDPAADAAPLLANDRGRAIDLSRFFCDDRRCFPVVGGALVYKDESHITKVFSRTLGPYLAAEYRALRLPPP